MRRISVLARCLWLTLWVPLIAYADPQQAGQTECKALISHSGFAEFVMPSEGGTQKLPIKATPGVKWTIQNSDYIDWIEILNGDSGTGPGTMSVRLGANPGKYCRVGVLTITGVQLFFGTPMRIGSPIRILQRGTETAGAEEPANPSPPPVIDLPPFSGKDSQTSSRPKSQYIKK